MSESEQVEHHDQDQQEEQKNQPDQPEEKHQEEQNQLTQEVVVETQEEIKLDQSNLAQQQASILNDLISDPTPIEIRIAESTEKGTGLNKHVVYNIKGSDKLGEYEVMRRFNEFFSLREVLLQRWPGIYIPPIPEKTIGGSGQDVVAERFRLLNIFLQKMSQLKYLYYSEEFQAIFLRSKEQDINKQLQQLPKLTSSDMIERYKQTFNLVQATDPSTESIQKMTSFQAFLKKIQAQLKNQLEQSKQIATSKKQLKDQLLLSCQNTMVTYEREVLSDCVGTHKKLVFMNPSATEINEQILLMKESHINPLDKIQDLITTEQRDLEALLQAIQTRENMISQKNKIEKQLKDEQEELQKVMQGKTSLKANLKKQSPEEVKQALEAQIAETMKEADNYKVLYQLVTLILVYKQIDQYKKDKVKAYYRIMNEMAQQELQLLAEQNNFWRAIGNFTTTVELQ